MADLLASSREASARIRVENIIHTDITVELMEILELYAELLLARAGLLDVRDKNIKENGGGAGGAATDDSATGLEEAAASIIYAAPRLARDVRELGIVRAMLMERFGREFGARANDNVDGLVPKRVSDKLKVEPPSERLVQAYLEEIAKTYGVDWPRNRAEVDELQGEVDDEDQDVDDDNADDDDGVGGGAKEAPLPSTPMKNKSQNQKIDLAGLSGATPPSSLEPAGAKSPVSVAPPAPRTDNPSPRVRLPGGAGTVNPKPKSAAIPKKNAAAGGAGGPGGSVPTVDDLAKRFSALKR